MSEAEGKFIEAEVVDAMLDEVKSSMQATIDALMQRNVNYRAGIKRLETHGAKVEAELKQAQEIIIPALTNEVEALRQAALSEPEPELLVVETPPN